MTSASRSRQTGPGAPNEQVDAVRYAVLRKLAPGLRHALMGELQTIQLSAELAVSMLGAGADRAKMRDTVDRLPGQCNVAVRTCRSMIEWLRPEEELTAPISESVKQCLKLAGDDWFLRGIEVTTDLPRVDVPVPKAALHELIVTALLVLADMHEGPADIHVVVEPIEEDHVDVVLQAHATDRGESFPPMSQYRKLGWPDLELLANARGIQCVCQGDMTSLRFPRVSPPPESK